MAFPFWGLKKKKISENTYQYAIKEMQAFFLEKLDSQPAGENVFLKQFLKKEMNQHSIGHLLMTFCANLKTYDYYAYLHNDKYTDALELSFERYFLTYGKDKTDELLMDIKACFDANAFASICADGKWNFPKDELYETCMEAGITSIDNAFSRQKAMTAAEKILKDAEVPMQYHSLYVNQNLLDDLFLRGKMDCDAKMAIAEAERRTPRQGKLREGEYQYIQLSQSLRPLYGIEKRVFMLGDAIDRITKKIHDYEEGQKAIKELGFILSTSVAQEKTKDWAFLGGLAEGIAGSGAGIAAAVNAVTENAEIERRNAQARQVANQTICGIYANASGISSSICDLENERKLMQHHLIAASNKVVMEQYSTNEIFQSLSFSSYVEKTGENCGLQLTITVNNSFKPDIPENVQVAVDGTLSAKIYFEKTLLDTVCVPLPLFGVTHCEKMTMYTDWYVEADGIYSVEITPNQLWIVEV